MNQPKRVTGFMPFAKELVYECPGLTAQEIYSAAVEYFDDQGKPLSAAQNPETSLVCTLHKSYQDYGLMRVKTAGRNYRFYPEGSVPEESARNGSSLPRDSHESVPAARTEIPAPPLTVSNPMETGPIEEVQPLTDFCYPGLTPGEQEKVKALVTLGRYANEQEAFGDLVRRGLETVLAGFST